MPSALITLRGAPVASSIASSRGCSNAAASTLSEGAAAARPSLRHRSMSSTPSAFTNSGTAVEEAPLNNAARLWKRFSKSSSSSGPSGSLRRYLAQARSSASMVSGVASIVAHDPHNIDKTSALYNLTASSPFLATILDASHVCSTRALRFATSSSSIICSKTPNAWCRAWASSGTPSSKRSSDCESVSSPSHLIKASTNAA
mmetsp:Transcript_18502/g.55304  ORF Transcript_18502/g.55304 Transcript_18502/m.55304 type:complete len:202 (-) Transcript_18502:666-1271(-)